MKEYLKDPKNSAKFQLLIYGILVVIVIIFIRVNNMLSKDEINNNKENVANTSSDLLDDSKDNLVLSNIKDNYEYEINMEIKTIDKVNNITYSGIKYNNEELISKIKDNTEEYFYVSNEIYSKIINGHYEKVNKEYVYDDINPYYLEIDNIYNYIEKAIEDDNNYLIRVDKIINDSDSNEYIVIEDCSEDSKVVLNINYTNLLKDDNIISFNVKYTITNIGKIKGEYFSSQKVIEN